MHIYLTSQRLQKDQGEKHPHIGQLNEVCLHTREKSIKISRFRLSKGKNTEENFVFCTDTQ